jgi:hypothetical protein
MALSKLMMGLLKQVSSPVIYSSFIPQLSSENIIIGTHDGSNFKSFSLHVVLVFIHIYIRIISL